MSATDELRRLLDERGIEYFKHEDGEPLRKLEKADKPATSWRVGGASVCAVPIEGSDLFDLWIDHCTPEQAVAATLDGGECENVGEITDFCCSECGARLYTETSDGFTMIECDEKTIIKLPRYCPNCGKAVKR